MNADDARTVGRQTLGPIFTGWAHLLLQSAKRRGLRRLYFVSRDGWLLRRVMGSLLEDEVAADRPLLEYLRLSRRATQLPAQGAIHAASIDEALTVGGERLTLAGLLEFHGIDEARYRGALAASGLAPDTIVTSGRQGVELVSCAELDALIREEAASQRKALLDYLTRAQGVGVEPAALVDIGWRASIQRNLSRVLSALPDCAPPSGLYFGLWREDGFSSALPDNAEGLIGDPRRARNLRESAPWQAAFLLEAVCRENEATVLSFRMANDSGVPIFEERPGPARIAEISSARLAEAVREGVIDHVRRHGHERKWQAATPDSLRRELQDRLLRLAFHPSVAEIALGEFLVHTESHDGQWNTPLILPRPAHPLRSPRAWLSGLASPWRGGYVMATGRIPAWGYRQLEALLVGTPPGFRRSLRQMALRLAHSPKSAA